MIGIINMFHNARGFGFVTDSIGTQHFLHITNFERGKTPLLGSYVSFVLGPPLRLGQALQCLNVKLATLDEIKQFHAERSHAGIEALATPSQIGGAAQ